MPHAASYLRKAPALLSPSVQQLMWDMCGLCSKVVSSSWWTPNSLSRLRRRLPRAPCRVFSVCTHAHTDHGLTQHAAQAAVVRSPTGCSRPLTCWLRLSAAAVPSPAGCGCPLQPSPHLLAAVVRCSRSLTCWLRLSAAAVPSTAGCGCLLQPSPHLLAAVACSPYALLCALPLACTGPSRRWSTSRPPRTLTRTSTGEPLP